MGTEFKIDITEIIDDTLVISSMEFNKRGIPVSKNPAAYMYMCKCIDFYKSTMVEDMRSESLPNPMLDHHKLAAIVTLSMLQNPPLHIYKNGNPNNSMWENIVISLDASLDIILMGILSNKCPNIYKNPSICEKVVFHLKSIGIDFFPKEISNDGTPKTSLMVALYKIIEAQSDSNLQHLLWLLAHFYFMVESHCQQKVIADAKSVYKIYNKPNVICKQGYVPQEEKA